MNMITVSSSEYAFHKYFQAFKVVETYFGSEGDGDSDAQVNPTVASDQQFFQFNGPQANAQTQPAEGTTHSAPGTVFQF